MSDNVIKVYKKIGETPLDCINKLKNEDPSLRFLPMTYAGRLDPLAEGVLLILIGDECHKKDEYLNLPKVYEIEVLFGFSTDTYDVMGKIVKVGISNKVTVQIKKIIKEFIGRIKQSYPPYSSRTVNGKPLFEWARSGKINEIEVPTHDVFVENIEILGKDEISGKDLLKEIREKISKVEGDFRQIEILNIWDDELKDKEEEKYPIVKLKISCGSGAYMRTIANDIGEKMGIPSLAFKIIRTEVGEYGIN